MSLPSFRAPVGCWRQLPTCGWFAARCLSGERSRRICTRRSSLAPASFSPPRNPMSETLGAATDPFATGLFGGSPKTAISASETSIGGTTVQSGHARPATSSSGRATRSFSEPLTAMPPSFGEERNIDGTTKLAPNARSSATRARTYRRSLSDKLTLSLIASGLVCGITPSSTRKQSGQPIQVLALNTPGGPAVAVRPGAGSSFSREEPHEQ